MKTEEEAKVHNMVESAVYEIKHAFWKSQYCMQALREMGQADNVKELEEAEKAVNKALSEYERLI